MRNWLLADPNPQQQQGFHSYPQQQPGFQGYPPQQQSFQGFPPQQQAYYPPPNQPVYNQPQQPIAMQQPAYADPEDPEAKGFEFNDQSIRKGFIRKVFAILTVSNSSKITGKFLTRGFSYQLHHKFYYWIFQVQLLVTFGVVCLFVFHTPTINFVMANAWLWWTSLIIFFVTFIILACCEGVRRKSPANFILLFLFTAAMSVMMGVMSASFDRLEVMIALGVKKIYLSPCFPLNLLFCRPRLWSLLHWRFSPSKPNGISQLWAEYCLFPYLLSFLWAFLRLSFQTKL